MRLVVVAWTAATAFYMASPMLSSEGCNPSDSASGHISLEVLRELRLPIRQRISFKMAFAVYKCLHGFAPVYLISDRVPVSTLAGRRQLRSSSAALCT